RGGVAVGARPPAVVQGSAGDVGAAGDPLHAAAGAARARIAVEVDADVADVTGVARGARVNTAADHQAAADAGRDDHAQRVVVAAGGSLPVFGRGDRHAV